MKQTTMGFLCAMGLSAAAIAQTPHDNEHYGNLVTYIRAKGLVPPSSER